MHDMKVKHLSMYNESSHVKKVSDMQNMKQKLDNNQGVRKNAND